MSLKASFALLLTLGMLLVSSALAAEPLENRQSDDYAYDIYSDGTACITEYNGADSVLTLPSGLDGCRVTTIGDLAFFECASLTSVTIPDSVTTIGDLAFFECASLTSVTIPDSVIAIGDYAFYNCDSLTSVTIPDSVTTVGVNPFYGCDKLTGIFVSPDHPALAVMNGMLFDKIQKKLISCPSSAPIAEYTVPQGIKVIGDDAFSGCSSLTSVTIPDSVTAIGNRAFFGCSSLASVTIPDSATTVGINPFESCRKLTNINVSSDHPTLAVMNGVLFDRSQERLISYFASAKNAEYTVPQGIKVIGDDAFTFCDSLTSVTIPDSVTTIGNDAFSLCSSLASVTIPGSVTIIGDDAFGWCSDYLILTVERDSYAALYCRENGLHYQYPDSFDWLLD